MGDHPVGSGYFAIGAGALFALVFVGSFVVDLAQINPYRLFQTWVLVAAGMLVWWGSRRVATGDRRDRHIGQDTFNFVVAIVGVTFALLALVSTP